MPSMQECIFCKLLQLKNNMISVTSLDLYSWCLIENPIFGRRNKEEKKKKKKLFVLCNDVI